MSTFGELGKKKLPTGPVQECEGEFWCDYCTGYAEDALYYPSIQVLVFTCNNGHLTTIEEIVL